MQNKDFFIFSLVLLLFSSFGYYFEAPTWSFPLSIFFFIGILAILSYHKYHLSKTTYEIDAREIEALSEQDNTKELEMAKRVQQALLAVEAPSHPDVSFAFRCDSANHLGGDFYTFINKNIQALSQTPKMPGVIEYQDSNQSLIGITVGDVAGHGVSSALVMALASGLFEKIGYENSSPAKTLEIANNTILKYIQSSQISHLTVVNAVLNVESKEITLSIAGHPSPILIRRDGSVKELDSGGVFLGVYADEGYEEKTFQLAAGDRVVFYTDGLPEAMNPDSEEYGFDRFVDLIKANKELSISQLQDKVFSEVKAFAKTDARDDQTLIILEIND